MPDVPLNVTASKPKTVVSCRHCATPFRASERETEFCCSGCRFVFHLLHKRGLEDFYTYGETKAPVGSGVFQDRDLGWLEGLQKQAEERGSDLVLQVQGISCAGCVWLLEALFSEQPGALSAEVHASAGTIRLRWKPGACDLSAYARDAWRFGYALGAPGEKPANALRPLVRKLGLCGALALNAMLFALPRYLGLKPGEAFASLFDLIAFALATLSILIGGTYFFKRALTALRHRELHIDLPISLGLAVAYVGSVLAWQTGRASFAYFDFVSIFTFLMLFGRWLQERAVDQNRNRLLSIRLTPGEISVLRKGLEVRAPAESLVAGERFWISRGQLVPVRSRLLLGTGTFALNWITGEPAPRVYSSGSLVASGARSLSPDRLEFLAMEDWSQGQLASLLAIDGTDRWRNAGLHGLIRMYLVFVLVVAGIGFVVWERSTGDWLSACQVLISVLVVSCPCALGVALPLLDDLAVARLQQSGVYVRDASLWQRLRRVKALLFDKTGTITLENLVVSNPEALDPLSERARRVLLHLVSDSLHPVATCLREALLTGEGAWSSAETHPARELTGFGLEWQGPEGCWRLGRASWASQGGAGTVFSLDGQVLATFTFREEIRPDAPDLVQTFLRRGLQVAILSGDDPKRVREMAASLGLPEGAGFGGLSPAEKARMVQIHWPESALMLGDGANDSLAFDAALCRGTPAVDTGLLEHKADFYLLGRSLSGLGELFDVSRLHHRATHTVFAFALTYNALAVSASLAGWMDPLVAAVIMPLSSLVSIGLVFTVLKTKIPTL